MQVFRCDYFESMLVSRVLAACLVVSSPPAAEETGAMGREIESRQGIGWSLYILKMLLSSTAHPSG
jgi:hypothetical protein